MTTIVTFRCDANHDLTFYLPMLSSGLSVMRKGPTDNGQFDCDEFDNEREDVPNCMHCNRCIATEVHDDN